MELSDYLRVLHKNWILIVACALLGVAAASAVSVTVTPKFVSNTQLFASVRSGDKTGTGDLVQGTSFAMMAVTSYVKMVNTARVLQPVIESLNLGLTAQQLSNQVSAMSPLNTVLVEITVTDDDPVLAAKIANAVGDNLIDVVVNVLEKPEGSAASLVQMKTVQSAVPATTPISPNIPLNLALGFLVGLAAGFGVAVLRAVLDTRIHSSHDIELVTDKPILGGMPFDSEAKRHPLVVHVDPRSQRAESFRALRTNLQFVSFDSDPATREFRLHRRSIVVTSSVPGEGKSTTAVNLAISLAETGARVVLVDGDLRLPRVAEYMGIAGDVGLADVLIGRAELSDALQRWGGAQLHVLPSGKVPPNPSELLGSRNMKRLLLTLSIDFDFVIIDAPSLLVVTDAVVISKLAGGVILVAASGRTKKTELAAAIRVLDQVDSKLLGIVVNMLPTGGPDTYGYGDYIYGGDVHQNRHTGTMFGRVKLVLRKDQSL